MRNALDLNCSSSDDDFDVTNWMKGKKKLSEPTNTTNNININEFNEPPRKKQKISPSQTDSKISKYIGILNNSNKQYNDTINIYKNELSKTKNELKKVQIELKLQKQKKK
eukprot:9775_1